MTKRLKRAAYRERVRRYFTMYVMSAIVLLFLLAPFLILFLIWRA